MIAIFGPFSWQMKSAIVGALLLYLLLADSCVNT